MERTKIIRLELTKIAFGGGCHWCTEAVFQSLKGVEIVEQGYVSSVDENSTFSEAVIVHFNTDIISLNILIQLHLHTHKSTSNHSMREKYRSAVYTFTSNQKNNVILILKESQHLFNETIITKVLSFKDFKPSKKQFQEYFYSNPQKPFCEKFINPKLKFILATFSKYIKKEKINIIANQLS